MRAEAFVLFRGLAKADVKSAARDLAVECEFRPGSIHLVTAEQPSAGAAMAAASNAALALVAALKDDGAIIEGIKLVREQKSGPAFVSRGIKPRPQTLMDAVAAPKPLPDNKREAFRNFMTSHRLRPTTWAKDAGVNSGEILGFLTGRSRGFPQDVAEKLARAANVRVEDMFR